MERYLFYLWVVIQRHPGKPALRLFMGVELSAEEAAGSKLHSAIVKLALLYVLEFYTFQAGANISIGEIKETHSEDESFAHEDGFAFGGTRRAWLFSEAPVGD